MFLTRNKAQCFSSVSHFAKIMNHPYDKFPTTSAFEEIMVTMNLQIGEKSI